MQEKILIENPNRFCLFPIHHPDLYKWFKDAQSSYWTSEEVTLTDDLIDWNTKLNENEKHFIGNVLQFFAASDGIVNENLATNSYDEVQYPEAKAYYAFQILIETIHSESYSLMIDSYIKDERQKQDFFNALQLNPAVQRKGEWAIKWINSDSFIERLIAFAVVEGVFFSGSFCSIFWLKSRGLMPGLAKYNELISRDEANHCGFACHLYKHHIENKLSYGRVKEIILDAFEIEKEFITESLPVSLIGMNHDLMVQYLQYVVDGLLVDLGYDKHFFTSNPFSFMANIAMQTKQNFFEGKEVTYTKSTGTNLEFNEEF